MNIADLLSPYDRRARLYPALLVILPVLVLVPALYGLDPTTLVPLAVVCGVGFLLTRVARNAGVKMQERLWASWGGAPTTQLLRHRNHEIDAHTKARYHKTLGERLGFALPSAVEERADPTDADQKYRAAIQLLINLTRDRARYPLVLTENAAYGFHRNGLGLRPLGVLIAVACVIWTVILITGQALRPPAVTALIASIVTLVAWLGVFTEPQVKRTAFAYARRLLECCDDLPPAREASK